MPERRAGGGRGGEEEEEEKDFAYFTKKVTGRCNEVVEWEFVGRHLIGGREGGVGKRRRRWKRRTRRRGEGERRCGVEG